MSGWALVTITLEVDFAYEDPKALASDLRQAIDNEEDVTVHIAGNQYHVVVVAMGKIEEQP